MSVVTSGLTLVLTGSVPGVDSTVVGLLTASLIGSFYDKIAAQTMKDY